MKVLLRTIVLGWLVFVSMSVQAQLKSTCETCFAAEITNALRISDRCTAYELKVYYTGNCAHDLSHVTVAVPACATISGLSNDHQCSQVFGYDPTTGLTGFKIENLRNFGSSPTKSFTVKFTLCSSSAACEAISCWSPMIAFKASTCFELDTLKGVCPKLQAHLEQKNPTCQGVSNGQIDVVIDQGTAPYQYLWSGGSSGSSLTNIPAGNYAVVVSDTTGATVTLNTTLTSPAGITISPTVVDATCNGKANGTILLSVSGGFGPYTYLWNTGDTTASLDSLKAGNYSVTVKDSSACSSQLVVAVKNEKVLTLSATQQLPSCNSSNGSITVTTNGGASPYQLKWSTGDTTSTVNNLPAGNYTVTAADAEGCQVKATYSLHDNNTLKISYNVTPTSCLDNATGAINITVTGGTKPYSYHWSTGDTTQNLQGLTSGLYAITVKDSLGCQITTSINVSKKTFQVSSTIVQPKCWSDSTGSISLLPRDGVSPYQYAWSNGAATDSIGNLAGGIYSVTITDSTGCSRSMSFSLRNPSQLQASSSVSTVSCNVFSVHLTVSGGTSPYSYQWSTGAQTADISNAVPGTYDVTITDAHSCVLSKHVQIDSVAMTCLITPLDKPPACLSSGNMIFTTVTDANYQWEVISSDSSWTITSGATNDILIFKAGNLNSSATFTLTISQNGCTKSCTYSVTSCTSGSTGGGGSSCADCFDSVISQKSNGETCATYNVTVSTNGNCRYDLSHVVIAIPDCASLSDYTDDGKWPLVVGKDPTTGLTGLKVDNVSNFGDRPASFNITFTLCWSDACTDQLRNWNPVVAYKAGQCIAYDTIVVTSSEVGCNVYPNPSRDSFCFSVTPDHDDVVTIEVYDQTGTRVCEPISSHVQGFRNNVFRIDATALKQNLYMYRVRTSTRTFSGRILKAD